MITGHKYHDDIQGILQTALTGVTQYTFRQYRNTGMVMPHIARGDVFSMTFQMPHRKYLGSALDSVHLHFIPLAAADGNVIIDFAWGWYNTNSVVPDVLPYTGSKTIPLVAADQYKQKLATVVVNLAAPASEEYSSVLFVKCTRATTGDTWGTGELALDYMDAHYLVDRFGSYLEAADA
jgi:hypothetical protein